MTSQKHSAGALLLLFQISYGNNILNQDLYAKWQHQYEKKIKLQLPLLSFIKCLRPLQKYITVSYVQHYLNFFAW